MMNCLEATKLISEAQEKALPLKTRMGLQVHLMMCGGCHNFKQQMGDLRAITRAYAKGENDVAEENPDSGTAAKAPSVPGKDSQ